MNKFIQPDNEAFIALATTKMPFGKYKGSRLVDLPERYIVWFSQKGFPKGKLGEMLQVVYEIKLNGLEYLFNNIHALAGTTKNETLAKLEKWS